VVADVGTQAIVGTLSARNRGRNQGLFGAVSAWRACSAVLGGVFVSTLSALDLLHQYSDWRDCARGRGIQVPGPYAASTTSSRLPRNGVLILATELASYFSRVSAGRGIHGHQHRSSRLEWPGEVLSGYLARRARAIERCSLHLFSSDVSVTKPRRIHHWLHMFGRLPTCPSFSNRTRRIADNFGPPAPAVMVGRSSPLSVQANTSVGTGRYHVFPIIPEPTYHRGLLFYPGGDRDKLHRRCAFMLVPAWASACDAVLSSSCKRVPHPELGVATSGATFFPLIAVPSERHLRGHLFQCLVGNLVRHLGPRDCHGFPARAITRPIGKLPAWSIRASRPPTPSHSDGVPHRRADRLWVPCFMAHSAARIAKSSRHTVR